jgi:hypothetical protein
MPTTIKLTNLRLPRLLGELSHSNQFLKMFSIISLAINLLGLALIFVLSAREPVVLTFDQTATTLKTSALPKPEIEVQAAIRHYLELRYQWTPANVRKQLEAARLMIHENAIKAYQGAAQNVVHFSTEKQVSQRAYGNSYEVDLTQKLVRITGDRITSIQNLKAAGRLNLELTFEYGPRTKNNPWGVYVTKEVEVN